ncbi:hypothetical protein CCO03_11380 [Comamonas serinivorans]|uniref:Uncharacterized protein n=2 Tax=Comamonas serinivorans TaxID=1082851 RepID=A0A1Y0ENH8_9BURK|nr:hypothetical protein CCO03_11380 [Comamonas serinivorans]
MAAEFTQDLYNQAKQNATTAEGKAYDEALSKALQAQADVRPAISACTKQHPGRQTAFGYFVVKAANSYEVVLAPSNAFTACLGKALSNRSVPQPPKSPWVNDFMFTTDPAPNAAKKG